MNSLAVKVVYDDTGTNVICKGSGYACEIGGSSQFDFNYLKLYAAENIYMGMSSNITSMGLVVDVKNMVLRGNSSTSLWDLGTNAYTFDKIYTKTLNFGSTGYIGMDANEHLLLGS